MVQQQFCNEKTLKGVELDRFVANLSRSLQQVCPLFKVTLHIMENILCKAYWQFSAENRGRVELHDTLFLDQLLFCQVGTNVEFLAMDGSQGDLGPAILDCFPFGDNMLTKKENCGGVQCAQYFV